MNNKITFFIVIFIVSMFLGSIGLNVASEMPGIIFSKEETAKIASKLRIIGELTPPFWTPTIEQVLSLEKNLTSHIRENTPKDRKPIRNLSKYKRQYLGITSDGKEKIYVNAFCDNYRSQTGDWKTVFVFVFGGGNCYFQIHYDPDTKQFSHFMINGES